MTLLGNINNLIDETDENEGYTTPAVIRKDREGLSFGKSLVIATALHPLTVALAWLLVFAMMLMGIKFTFFDRPKPKASDIEFVLVDKEATPVNKHTKNRADKNSRTGGINDPKRPVSMPSPSPRKSSKASPQLSDTQKLIRKVQQQQQKIAKTQAKRAVQQAPNRSQSNARPHPPSSRPSARPMSAPRVTTRPTSPFTVPIPKNLPSGRSFSTGPIGGSGLASSSGGGRYAPTPSLSPTLGGGGSSGSKLSHGSGGSGNVGNPGGGGGRPGIDAIKEPDFGPYMRELQRRIKQNWDPPKGNESKRVVLLFKIARDGRLLSCRVFKPSGLPNSDKAALNAVELTAPFKPLPPDFKGASIDIQFTFDYNVFGATNY